MSTKILCNNSTSGIGTWYQWILKSEYWYWYRSEKKVVLNIPNKSRWSCNLCMLISNMSSQSLHFNLNCTHNLDELKVCQFVWTRVAAWSHDWLYLESVFYIPVVFVAGAERSPALSHMTLSSCVVPASNYFTASRRRRLHSALWQWKAPSSTRFLTPIFALFINARSHLMSFSVLKIWCSRAELRSGAFCSRRYV